MSDTIPGVPDGYRIKRIGTPNRGEFYISQQGVASIAGDGLTSSAYSIIEPTPLQIREGAYYERRDGKVAGPAERHEASYPWSLPFPDGGEDFFETYTDEGRADMYEKTNRDLIREVPAPAPEAGEGWRLLTKEEAKKLEHGDQWHNGKMWVPIDIDSAFLPYHYRRRISPKFRPFQSAEEFKPHHGRLMRRKDTSNHYVRLSCFSDETNWQGWFDNYVFDDDGSPVGVEVKE